MAKVILPPFEYPIDPAIYKICGADEAGRGPLMGNVVAACVLLDPLNPISGLNDSKQLSEKKRDALEPVIKEKALAYGIGQCTPQEIDTLNILHASMEAMVRAYRNMVLNGIEKGTLKEGFICDLMLVDGNRTPKNFEVNTLAVVKGDARVSQIAAASILAKVERDRQMYELDKAYPEYQFAKHKGYPTKAHLEILQKLPILEFYRKSYGPVKKLLSPKTEIDEQELWV